MSVKTSGSWFFCMVPYCMLGTVYFSVIFGDVLWWHGVRSLKWFVSCSHRGSRCARSVPVNDACTLLLPLAFHIVKPNLRCRVMGGETSIIFKLHIDKYKHFKFVFLLFYFFEANSQNCEKLLLASSVLYICPSVRLEQLGFHWAEFHEMWHLRIFFFEKSVGGKLKVSLKSDENEWCYTWRPIYMFYHISLSSS